MCQRQERREWQSFNRTTVYKMLLTAHLAYLIGDYHANPTAVTETKGRKHVI